jgi:hypothetical protein
VYLALISETLTVFLLNLPTVVEGRKFFIAIFSDTNNVLDPACANLGIIETRLDCDDLTYF